MIFLSTIFINTFAFFISMLKSKKSKVLKMRGTSSHGWGHKKKHRGAGNRGGKGLSGTGARGDAQKCSVLTNSKSILQKMAAAKGVKLSKVKMGSTYFGKTGFTSIKKTSVKTLSISHIENNFDSLVENGLIVKDGTNYVLDATISKYDKILGKGIFTKKLNIITKAISQSAKANIEAAGGSVEVTGTPSEKSEA